MMYTFVCEQVMVTLHVVDSINDLRANSEDGTDEEDLFAVRHC